MCPTVRGFQASRDRVPPRDGDSIGHAAECARINDKPVTRIGGLDPNPLAIGVLNQPHFQLLRNSAFWDAKRGGDGDAVARVSVRRG